MTLQQQNDKVVRGLPRLCQPMKMDPVLERSPKPTNPQQRIEAGISSYVKGIGSSPSKSISMVNKGAKLVRDKALTAEQQKALNPEQVPGAIKNFVVQFLDSQPGLLFRQTFARRVKTKVFGTPRSELAMVLYAADSLAYLAVAAIKEDSIGMVNKDIAVIMRLLGNTITQIKKFMNESPIHWTDVQFRADDPQARRVGEMDLLIEHLQSDLKRIIEAYEQFARDMNVSAEEMRASQMATGMAVV